MNKYRSMARSVPKLLAIFSAMTLFAISLGLNVGPVQSDPPEISHDGLHLLKGHKSSIVYVDPEADFSIYTKYMMLDPYVSFKKNWERDTRVAGRRVPKDYIAKMKVAAADLLIEVFQEELEAVGGYPLVDTVDDDVLLLRPVIVDLMVTAPDVPVAGRVRQYTSSSMAATLYLELYDSVTGDILLRLIDRQAVRDHGYARWANSVTNRADAKRIYKRWAVWMRTSWDDFRSKHISDETR